ncbi:MAG: hypothetical protein ACOYXW_02675 [Actinomycetota bacterium]
MTPVDGLRARTRPPQRRGPSRGAVVLALVAAALAGVIVGGAIALGGGGGNGGSDTVAQPTQTAAPQPIQPVAVTSFDPSGGSGFRDEGDGTWSTQTYTTAEFGALKPGVGLLLDLGEAREVSAVTLPSATAGLAVELLAGDEPPSGQPESMTPTDSATTAQGPTALSGDEGGAHRYWMVWVTQLAPTEGGFSATVATPTVEGPA